MPNLVIEIGTEEIPAASVQSALAQIKLLITKGLTDARLSADSLEVQGTPRRLVVLATGVPGRQPDQVREVRGPSTSVAFDANGAPTGAAIGFAKKNGIDVSALEVQQSGQGEYVVARVHEQGRSATEVIGLVMADTLKALTFPKMMRWGAGSTRFVRPIRWICALLDDSVVPMEYAGVSSGRSSRGHRFLAPEPYDVPSADDYLPLLTAAKVVLDPVARKESIRSQVNALAEAIGGTVPWDETLLDENTFLVEYPTALMGRFDSDYLQLPRPALVMVMKKHQRYFPVEDPSGQLLPVFIAVRNGDASHLEVVAEGNERVLTARFSDARHFFENDCHSSLEEMSGKLGRLLFQEKLGTMAQKRDRLVILAQTLAESLELSQEDQEMCIDAARLCKADLVSQMVIELPALQGVMGREFALREGRGPHLAEGIVEHYKPRSAGDALPESAIGTLLAIADRLDTLVGYVGCGTVPSGSSDPFGLRRAAQGVVQITANEAEMPPLVDLIAQAAKGYAVVNQLTFDLDTLCGSLNDIFDQRIQAYLEDRGIRYDLIETAVSGGISKNSIVYALVKRAEALSTLKDEAGFVATVQSAARVANILKSSGVSNSAPVAGREAIHGDHAHSLDRSISIIESEGRAVDESLLNTEAERALYADAQGVVRDVARYATECNYPAVYAVLEKIQPAVATFFDEVMVMVDDERVRRNRLALLAFVDSLYKTLGDFTKVVAGHDR